jgi:uncharacterized protein
MVKSWEYACRWNEWNIEHVAKHGVAPEEAEDVIRSMRPPFPEYVGDGKWRVLGQTVTGRYLRVIFIISPAETFYVIHAMPLSETGKRRLRRRRR